MYVCSIYMWHYSQRSQIVDSSHLPSKHNFQGGTVNVRVVYSIFQADIGCSGLSSLGVPGVPNFGRSFNPISTKGADYAHQIILTPPDFQTFRRPCCWERNGLQLGKQHGCWILMMLPQGSAARYVLPCCTKMHFILTRFRPVAIKPPLVYFKFIISKLCEAIMLNIDLV